MNEPRTADTPDLTSSAHPGSDLPERRRRWYLKEKLKAGRIRPDVTEA